MTERGQKVMPFGRKKENERMTVVYNLIISLCSFAEDSEKWTRIRAAQYFVLFQAILLLPTRRPTPEGRPSSWQIIEPYVSTEEKSHLSVRDLFLTIFGCK